MGKIGKVSKINGILRCQLLILSIWLCSLGFVGIPYGLAGEQEIKPKEAMFVSVFLVPGEKMMLVKNVILNFEDVIIGPPVNITIPAFNNGFTGAKCELIRQARKCVIHFEINHSSVIGESAANTYADIVAQEFLNIFGYTGLNKTYEFQETKETTIVTRKWFGYIDYNVQKVSLFLKYKPINGCFSELINDRLLDKYVITEDPVSGILPTYTLKKNLDSSFSWGFEIMSSTSTTFSSDIKEYTDAINLKELLNSNIPIVETPCQQASIIFVIQNITRVNADKTYIIDIKDIRPEGYTIAKSELLPDSVDIKYEPLTPIDNITIDINVNSSTSDQNPFILILILIAIAVTTLIIAFFLLRKKRKRSEGQ
jgi:hypothetical protein